MNLNDFVASITNAVIEALKQGVELEPGERCPCCGTKKRKHKLSEKMLEANRRNIKKAFKARQTNSEDDL